MQSFVYVDINDLILLTEELAKLLKDGKKKEAESLLARQFTNRILENCNNLRSKVKDTREIKNRKIYSKSLRVNAVTDCTLLHISAWLDYPDLVQFLLQKDFEIEAKTRILQTPLNIAATGNSVNAASVLLANGANIESCAKHEESHLIATHTPLIRACGGGHERLEMIELLLENGANPKATTFRNAFPIDDLKKTYRTTIHLLIDNLYKSKTDEQKSRVIKAIKSVLDKIPKEERKEFLAKREICTEQGNLWCSAIEIIHYKIKQAEIANCAEEIEYLRKIRDVFIENGASTQPESPITFAKINEIFDAKIAKIDPKPGISKKAADLFQFWAAFSIPNEILSVILTFESASRLLQNDYIDFSDKRVRFFISFCIAVGVHFAVAQENHSIVSDPVVENTKHDKVIHSK